jgi:hypothetical protein
MKPTSIFGSVLFLLSVSATSICQSIIAQTPALVADQIDDSQRDAQRTGSATLVLFAKRTRPSLSGHGRR